MAVMTQPRFLARCRFNREVVQTDTLRLTWRKVYRSEPTSYGGQRLTDTGRRDKSVIEVRPRGTDDAPMLNAQGVRRTQVNWAEEVERTAAGVKQVIRALRPQEAQRLDALDVEITAAKARLEQLRAEREATVREAWQRANVVRLAEVEALIVDEAGVESG